MVIPFEALRKHDPRRAIFEQNAKTCPLLRLPPEIRCQIYREVLGDRFIHLKHVPYPLIPGTVWTNGVWHWDYLSSPTTERPKDRDPSDSWFHYVCNKGGPKSDDEFNCVGMKKDPTILWAMVLCWPLDAPTWPNFELPYTPLEEMYDREMHLKLLRACRQIYAEASPILWNTNTFSFRTAGSCLAFFQGCRKEQKAALRSLHLVVDIDQGSKSWNLALREPLIRDLKGLLNLRLIIKSSIRVEYYRKVKSRGLHLLKTPYEGLVRLSQLPQLSVDVCMATNFCSAMSESWLESEKEDYAKSLKDRLLMRPLL
ncbi:MAG: hypothetical protein HETSPECPRED_006870 [Heterodermia speciosa]|uniref:DUF7730 domain-containing protein n=1 Tax=Heterodermia speciosa TaxID=116794 RepID=A0A8H3FPZ5_9LECA|nr:MAG: hypothetical protein HETSPECPRED_006870 [Heterodermia speciosa]